MIAARPALGDAGGDQQLTIRRWSLLTSSYKRTVPGEFLAAAAGGAATVCARAPLVNASNTVPIEPANLIALPTARRRPGPRNPKRRFLAALVTDTLDRLGRVPATSP